MRSKESQVIHEFDTDVFEEDFPYVLTSGNIDKQDSVVTVDLDQISSAGKPWAEIRAKYPYLIAVVRKDGSQDVYTTSSSVVPPQENGAISVVLEALEPNTSYRVNYYASSTN